MKHCSLPAFVGQLIMPSLSRMLAYLRQWVEDVALCSVDDSQRRVVRAGGYVPHSPQFQSTTCRPIQ